MSVNPARLTELEACSGVILGAWPDPDKPANLIPPPKSPFEALVEACASAILRPPCMVAFSGGRDSSLVLAAAVSAAKKVGAPWPVPVTLRFSDDPDSSETDYQELVINHLQIKEWVRLEAHDEIELLGARATRILQTLGHLWPANYHCLEPVMEIAAGGSVLTGLDGDGLLGGWRWSVLARGPRHARDIMTIFHATLPRSLRRVVAYSSVGHQIGWLRDPVSRGVQRAINVERGDQPARWSAWVRWWSRRRYLAVARSSLDAVAALNRSIVLHPLLDAGVLDSVGSAGNLRGFSSRTAAMQILFPNAVPEQIAARTTKAFFDKTLWGERSRSFAKGWQGKGLNPEIVDHEAIKQEWLKDTPDFRSATVLQKAWLASQD